MRAKKIVLWTVSFFFYSQLSLGAVFAQNTFDTSEEIRILQNLRSEFEQLNENIPRQEATIYAIQTQKDLYWGFNKNNFDVTWFPLLGFILPGFPQIISLLDDSAPPWLFVTNILQLISLGVLSAGLYQTWELNQQAMGGATLQSNDTQLATGLVIGGASAYTLLGFLPSAVVAGHDQFVGNGRPSQLYELIPKLNEDKKRHEELKDIIKIYSAAADGRLEGALNLAKYISEDALKSEELKKSTLNKWKKGAIDQKINEFQYEQDIDNKLLLLKSLLTHPYLDFASISKDSLYNEQEELMSIISARNEQAKQQKKKESAEKEEKENSKIYWYQAVELASNGKLEEAVSLAKKISSISPYYEQAQQKLTSWSSLIQQRDASERLKNYEKYFGIKTSVQMPMVAGEWIFEVGTKKSKYTAYISQIPLYHNGRKLIGPYLTGYIESSSGKRFYLRECPGDLASGHELPHQRGECSEISIIHPDLDIFEYGYNIEKKLARLRNSNYGFILREGDWVWVAYFANPSNNSPWIFKNGKLINFHSRKTQSFFTGRHIP